MSKEEVPLMNRKVSNCLNCGWCRNHTEFASAPEDLELYFRCCLTQELHLARVTHLRTCDCWMGYYYGDPLQLDYFGYQEFGMAWEAPDYCEGLTYRISKPREKDMTPICLQLYGGGETWGIVGNMHQAYFADELAVTLLSSEQLFRLIRLRHPDRYGEAYGRLDVVCELRRRGRSVLGQLGWPDRFNSMYKNRYTGTLETLSDRYASRSGSSYGLSFDAWLSDNACFILENWYPEELWEDSALLRDGTQMELEVV